MSMMSRFLAGAAGIAALAAAGPANAQYYRYAQPYGYAQTYGYAQPYGYAQQYGYAQPYGYANAYGVNTNYAAQRCSAAVQSRLYNRTSIAEILGAVLGANTQGHVVSITQVNPRSNGTVRVRGLASSGRYAYNSYGPYGVGAYGALGYNYANQADLGFRCDVAANGAVYNVSINRR